MFVILFVQESGEFFQGGWLSTLARDQHEAREGSLACWQGLVMKNRGWLIYIYQIYLFELDHMVSRCPKKGLLQVPESWRATRS